MPEIGSESSERHVPRRTTRKSLWNSAGVGMAAVLLAAVGASVGLPGSALASGPAASVATAPSGTFGNPLSAIAFADPSMIDVGGVYDAFVTSPGASRRSPAVSRASVTIG